MNFYFFKFWVKKFVFYFCFVVYVVFGCCVFKWKSGSIDIDSCWIRIGYFGDSVDCYFEIVIVLVV